MADRSKDHLSELKPITRRQAISQALALTLLGVPLVGTLIQANGPGSGSEHDPLAVLRQPAVAQLMQAPGIDSNHDFIALTILRPGNFGPDATNPFGADLALMDSSNQVGTIFGRNGFVNPYQIYQVLNDNTKTEDFSPVAINVLAGPQGGAFQTVLLTYDLFGTILPVANSPGAFLGEDGAHPVGGTPLKYLAVFCTTLDITGPAVKINATTTLGTPYPNVPSVGLPTGTAGSTGISAGDHKHSFTGRFHLDGYLRNATIIGGTFPVKFMRFTINSGITRTMQRLSIYAQVAPTGGTETYAVVNAAGTVQGTALTLNAGSKEATQTESATLTGGLGGTTYYLAQTASNSNPASTDLNLDLEYTMAV